MQLFFLFEVENSAQYCDDAQNGEDSSDQHTDLLLEYSDKEQLARAIGTDIAVAVAVNDEGLAKAIEAKITDGVMERKG